MKIDVVIATRDRPSELGRLLERLLAQEHPEFSVVVADQSSGPATREVADGFASRGVRYLRVRDRGLGLALNSALAAGGAEAAAIIADRAAPEPHWLSALDAELASPDAPDLVFGRVSPESPSESGVELGLADSPRRKVFEGQANVFTGHGVNMALKLEAWRRFGGFDPAFGSGGPLGSYEDADFRIRVLLGGGRVVYSPTPAVRFAQERSWTVLRLLQRSYGIGAGACAAKHLRLGRPLLASGLLAGWIFHNGLRAFLGGLVRLKAIRSAAGLCQLVYPWIGFARGLFLRLDRDRQVFVMEDAG